MPRLSRIRLDPVAGSYVMRVYKEPVDVDAPIEAMSDDFMSSGHVTVAGDDAFVEALAGTIPLNFVRSVYTRLQDYGVARMHYTRHVNGKVIKKCYPPITEIPT